jgi:hypothetical protein
MISSRTIAAIAFIASVAAGTWIDPGGRPAPAGPTVLAGDFHVHAFPADGMLPVWAIQREAERRGLDVVAITNHNRNFAMPLARASGLLKDYPIIIPSQELTTPHFHLAAIGLTNMVDWRLPASAAIEAIHQQNGIAIAAHPAPTSWTDNDPRTLAMLDGVEVAHPTILGIAKRQNQLRAFYDRVRRINPRVAPIGSTDYHGGGAPLGVCRTYVIVDEVSVKGVLDAIRRGRTVAAGPGDRLVGDAELVSAVQQHLAAPQSANFGRSASSGLSLLALISLAGFVALDRPRRSASRR